MPKLSKLFTVKQINAIRAELKAKHGNKCAICDKPREAFKKELSVDHRHSDGLIRGLLCFRDNKYLVGRFTLHKIIPVVQYLVKYELTGELCEKYGKMLSDMKDDIKSVVSAESEVKIVPRKQKKARGNIKAK